MWWPLDVFQENALKNAWQPSNISQDDEVKNTWCPLNVSLLKQLMDKVNYCLL
jgi:hypothetical protein